MTMIVRFKGDEDMMKDLILLCARAMVIYVAVFGLLLVIRNAIEAKVDEDDG